MIAALMSYGPGHWGPGHGPGPWMLLWPLMWIAVIVAVVLITRKAGLWKRFSGGGGGARRDGWGWGPPPGKPADGGQRQSAEDILAERFARGEIDESEFHERLTALRATRDA